MNKSDIFLQAAIEAEKQLPEKENEIQELQRKLMALQSEINHLKTIVAYGKNIPIFTGLSNSNSLVTLAEQMNALDAPTRKKHPRGQPLEHIKGILEDGRAYRPHKLNEEIAKKYHVAYSDSTLYANLARGKSLGIFEQTENNEWRIKEAKPKLRLAHKGQHDV